METIVVNFEKLKNGEPEEEMVYFNSKAQIIMNISDNYKPLEGKSYIPLPKELQNSLKGLINLKNEDIESFRWCHIRYLNPQEVHPEHIKKNIDKKMVQELNYQGVDFPVSLKDYNKNEEQNNININVFGYENKQFYPIYVSKQKNEDILNLLLITEDENKHYMLIKDFNRMMYNKTKHKEKKHFCMYCLQNFSTEQKFIILLICLSVSHLNSPVGRYWLIA